MKIPTYIKIRKRLQFAGAILAIIVCLLLFLIIFALADTGENVTLALLVLAIPTTLILALVSLIIVFIQISNMCFLERLAEKENAEKTE